MGEDVRECPFEDCDWSYEYDANGYGDELTADHRSERHYEREHAGRVRIQITLEAERLLGDRDPKTIRNRILDDYSTSGGYDVAHVRTEVVEESDDHAKIDRGGENDE